MFKVRLPTPDLTIMRDLTGPELLAFADRFSPDVTLIIEPTGSILHASESTERIGGFDPQALIGRSALDLVHPDDLEYTLGSLFEASDNPGTHGAIELRLLTADGGWQRYEIRSFNPPTDLEGRIVVALTDISGRSALPERRRALESLVLRIGERCAGASFEGLGMVLDELARKLGELVEADEVELSSISPDGVAVHNWGWRRGDRWVLIHPGDPNAVLDRVSGITHPARLHVELHPFAHATVEQPVWNEGATLGAVRICWHDPDARRHWDEGNGALLDAAARILVMTAQRVQREMILSYQATHDALTGLANRTRLLGALDHEINRSSGRHETFVALAYCDLDRFKAVNDRYGHGAGDELLVTTARRLEAAVRHGDLVCRVGGDEFVVLCPDVSGPEEALRLADRMVDQIGRPVSLSCGAELSVTASVGVAFVHGRNERDVTADELLRRADEAMYEAKVHRNGAIKLVPVDLSPTLAEISAGR